MLPYYGIFSEVSSVEQAVKAAKAHLWETWLQVVFCCMLATRSDRQSKLSFWKLRSRARKRVMNSPMRWPNTLVRTKCVIFGVSAKFLLCLVQQVLDTNKLVWFPLKKEMFKVVFFYFMVSCLCRALSLVWNQFCTQGHCQSPGALEMPKKSKRIRTGRLRCCLSIWLGTFFVEHNWYRCPRERGARVLAAPSSSWKCLGPSFSGPRQHHAFKHLRRCCETEIDNARCWENGRSVPISAIMAP